MENYNEEINLSKTETENWAVEAKKKLFTKKPGNEQIVITMVMIVIALVLVYLFKNNITTFMTNAITTMTEKMNTLLSGLS